jgi:pimeloyl-ACP methyl ester carboxylesterase
VLVRGVELAVREEGEGRAVVWGHGLLSSVDQEDDAGVLAPPSVEGVRLVRYDARGHGRSEATRADRDYRWRNLALDMLGVLDGLGLGTAVLGGSSMGCATALHAAVAEPARVEGLVLVIPPTAWGGRRVQAAMYRAGARVVGLGGMGPFAALARSAPPPRMLTGELAPVHEVAVRAMAGLDRRVVPHVLRGAATSDLPPKEALASLDVPTLVLAWEGDPTHPTATAHELCRLLPRVTGHVASTVDEVRRWPSLVTAFLRDR